ncbi:class II aldolase/adducin family protein [Treponema sp. OMZ 840]|uniref:class II aldolase/adducin family protein n=1 Tax=Treponema sp. OMZ 840 TaxID=244313 RepID=UPI003D8E44C0
MEKKDYFEERTLVARYMKRMYDRNLTTISGGNISLRIDDERFCITPSGLDKGNLSADVIAIVRFDGTNLTPHLKLSIETEMHRAVLSKRPDINAVIHAHPVYASSFATAMPCQINTKLNAETYYILGEVANVPYRLMGTTDLAQIVAEHIKDHNALLMENHGAIAVGTELLTAFDRIELLERSAVMTVITRGIIGSHELSPEQIKEIQEMRGY